MKIRRQAATTPRQPAIRRDVQPRTPQTRTAGIAGSQKTIGRAMELAEQTQAKMRKLLPARTETGGSVGPLGRVKSLEELQTRAAELRQELVADRRELKRLKERLAEVYPPGDPVAGAAVLDGRHVEYETSEHPMERGDAVEESGETSSFSIADQYGNLVSVTHSVNGSWGSGMFVPGTGIVLNNRMPYYSTDENDLNVLVEGKRTRHTINPALATKDGKPYLAWNTPGGDTSTPPAAALSLWAPANANADAISNSSGAKAHRVIAFMSKPP